MEEITTINNDFRDEILAVWEIIVLLLILIVTIIGNSFVLFALYLRRYTGRRRKLTRMYFFMMHLSIADLATGFLNVTPQLAWDITFRFQGGNVLCKIIKYGQPFGNYLSSYVLIATAIDRYHAVCHPFSYCRTTYRQSRIMVYTAWLMALILCIPQVFIFSYQEIEKDLWDCWATFVVPYGERAYVTWFSFTVFLLPFAVLVYTYACICHEIWRDTEITVFGQSSELKRIDSADSNRQPVISRARIKTIKQMITIVGLHVFTHMPFIGCQLWSTWDPHAKETTFSTGATFTIFLLLSTLSNCVNPWIYMGFNRELRAILRTYVKKNFISSSMNLDNEGSHGHSSNSSTRSTILGTMVRFASLYRGKSTRERSADAEELKNLRTSEFSKNPK